MINYNEHKYDYDEFYVLCDIEQEMTVINIYPVLQVLFMYLT